MDEFDELLAKPRAPDEFDSAIRTNVPKNPAPEDGSIRAIRSFVQNSAEEKRASRLAELDQIMAVIPPDTPDIQAAKSEYDRMVKEIQEETLVVPSPNEEILRSLQDPGRHEEKVALFQMMSGDEGSRKEALRILLEGDWNKLQEMTPSGQIRALMLKAGKAQDLYDSFSKGEKDHFEDLLSKGWNPSVAAQEVMATRDGPFAVLSPMADFWHHFDDAFRVPVTRAAIAGMDWAFDVPKDVRAGEPREETRTNIERAKAGMVQDIPARLVPLAADLKEKGYETTADSLLFTGGFVGSAGDLFGDVFAAIPTGLWGVKATRAIRAARAEGRAAHALAMEEALLSFERAKNSADKAYELERLKQAMWQDQTNKLLDIRSRSEKVPSPEEILQSMKSGETEFLENVAARAEAGEPPGFGEIAYQQSKDFKAEKGYSPVTEVRQTMPYPENVYEGTAVKMGERVSIGDKAGEIDVIQPGATRARVKMDDGTYEWFRPLEDLVSGKVKFLDEPPGMPVTGRLSKQERAIAEKMGLSEEEVLADMERRGRPDAFLNDDQILQSFGLSRGTPDVPMRKPGGFVGPDFKDVDIPIGPARDDLVDSLGMPVQGFEEMPPVRRWAPAYRNKETGEILRGTKQSYHEDLRAKHSIPEDLRGFEEGFLEDDGTFMSIKDMQRSSMPPGFLMPEDQFGASFPLGPEYGRLVDDELASAAKRVDEIVQGASVPPPVAPVAPAPGENAPFWSIRGRAGSVTRFREKLDETLAEDVMRPLFQDVKEMFRDTWLLPRSWKIKIGEMIRTDPQGAAKEIASLLRSMRSEENMDKVLSIGEGMTLQDSVKRSGIKTDSVEFSDLYRYIRGEKVENIDYLFKSHPDLKVSADEARNILKKNSEDAYGRLFMHAEVPGTGGHGVLFFKDVPAGPKELMEALLQRQFDNLTAETLKSLDLDPRLIAMMEEEAGKGVQFRTEGGLGSARKVVDLMDQYGLIFDRSGADRFDEVFKNSGIPYSRKAIDTGSSQSGKALEVISFGKDDVAKGVLTDVLDPKRSTELLAAEVADELGVPKKDIEDFIKLADRVKNRDPKAAAELKTLVSKLPLFDKAGDDQKIKAVEEALELQGRKATLQEIARSVKAETRPLSDAERSVLKERMDPVEAMVRTNMRLRTASSLYDVQDAVAAKYGVPAGYKQPPGSPKILKDIPPKKQAYFEGVDSVLVPDDPRWGPLRDHFLPKPIFDEIKGVLEAIDPFADAVDAVVSAGKKGLISNIPLAFANLTTNGAYSVMGGVSILDPGSYKYWDMALSDLLQYRGTAGKLLGEKALKFDRPGTVSPRLRQALGARAADGSGLDLSGFTSDMLERQMASIQHLSNPETPAGEKARFLTEILSGSPEVTLPGARRESRVAATLTGATHGGIYGTAVGGPAGGVAGAALGAVQPIITGPLRKLGRVFFSVGDPLHQLATFYKYLDQYGDVARAMEETKRVTQNFDPADFPEWLKYITGRRPGATGAERVVARLASPTFVGYPVNWVRLGHRGVRDKPVSAAVALGLPFLLAKILKENAVISGDLTEESADGLGGLEMVVPTKDGISVFDAERYLPSQDPITGNVISPKSLMKGDLDASVQFGLPLSTGIRMMAALSDQPTVPSMVAEDSFESWRQRLPREDKARLAAVQRIFSESFGGPYAALGKLNRKLQEQLRGEKNYKGEDIEVTPMLLEMLFGYQARRAAEGTTGQDLDVFRLRDQKGDIREQRRELKRHQRSGRLTEEEKAEEMDEFDKMIREK